jgi:signal peptidase I
MSSIAAESPTQLADAALDGAAATYPSGVADAAPAGRTGFRQMTDAMLSLAIAVVLVRAFAVEGYMISTGSMAPTLPGFHKRVTCPDCRYEFAVGVADDEELAQTAEHHGEDAKGTSSPPPKSETAVCPNCGLGGIDLRNVSRNQGDQLLVYKNAYLFRDPRRWEVVVFRNPDRSVQAYVKRVVGLPGETVEVIDGDVWIDGKRIRKNLQEQRAVRIPVFDQQFAPQSGDGWQPRWVPEENGGWTLADGGFDIAQGSGAGSHSAQHWVAYRHWVREGGQHRTAVKIPPEIAAIDFSFPALYPLRYDAQRQELSHVGVLSDADRQRILPTFSEPAFGRLVNRLAEESHLSPIIDDYGYNRRRDTRRPVAVRDLMVAFTLSLKGGNGRFFTELTDGHRRFRFTLDVGTRDVSVGIAGKGSPISRARLKAEALTKPLLVEMSLFDRQLLVAVDGHRVFKPIELNAVPRDTPAPRKPVRFGASALDARVTELRLYRDIYYTKKGRETKWTVGKGEYFVLGDNSPISADSRVWPNCGVPRELLLGKPFLVHLPSRPGRLQLGKFEMNVRIPDFSRIRYIR